MTVNEMAKIVRNIDNISNISGSDYIIEIEYIEFIDDKGNVARYKLDALVPLSVEKCREVSTKFHEDVDWDKDNFHFAVGIGEVVKD